MHLFNIEEQRNVLQVERSSKTQLIEIGVQILGLLLTVPLIFKINTFNIPIVVLFLVDGFIIYQLVRSILRWQHGEIFRFDKQEGKLFHNGKPVRMLAGIQEVRLTRTWDSDGDKQYELSLRVKGQRKFVLEENVQEVEMLELGKRIAGFVAAPFRRLDGRLDYQQQQAQEEAERYQVLVRQFEEKYEGKKREDLQAIESNRKNADYVREAAKNLLKRQSN